MSVIATLIYGLFCLLVGIVGRHRRCGFVGVALISAVVTPVLMLVVLYLTAPREEDQTQ
jgi:Na+/melibiose symporter-like transporter